MAGKRYAKPGKLNIVSFVLLAAGISALYSAVQFGPPYYRKWQAKGVLSEAANKLYPKRRLDMNQISGFINGVRKETLEKLHALGIEDTTMTVQISKDANQVGVRAVYSERIVHPLVGKTTILRFRPYNIAQIK